MLIDCLSLRKSPWKFNAVHVPGICCRWWTIWSYWAWHGHASPSGTEVLQGIDQWCGKWICPMFLPLISSAVSLTSCQRIRTAVCSYTNRTPLTVPMEVFITLKAVRNVFLAQFQYLFLHELYFRMNTHQMDFNFWSLSNDVILNESEISL